MEKIKSERSRYVKGEKRRRHREHHVIVPAEDFCCHPELLVPSVSNRYQYSILNDVNSPNYQQINSLSDVNSNRQAVTNNVEKATTEPPSWFLNYMNMFKKEMKHFIVETIHQQIVEENVTKEKTKKRNLKASFDSEAIINESSVNDVYEQTFNQANKKMKNNNFYNFETEYSGVNCDASALIASNSSSVVNPSIDPKIFKKIHKLQHTLQKKEKKYSRKSEKKLERLKSSIKKLMEMQSLMDKELNNTNSFTDIKNDIDTKKIDFQQGVTRPTSTITKQIFDSIEKLSSDILEKLSKVNNEKLKETENLKKKENQIDNCCVLIKPESINDDKNLIKIEECDVKMIDLTTSQENNGNYYKLSKNIKMQFELNLLDENKKDSFEKLPDELDGMMGEIVGRHIVLIRANKRDLFKIKWPIKNTGVKYWTENTELRHTWGSSSLKILNSKIQCPKLAPNETGNIVIYIQVPDGAGIYESYWRFYHNDKRFGSWLGCHFFLGEMESSFIPFLLNSISSPSIENNSTIIDITSDFDKKLQINSNGQQNIEIPENNELYVGTNSIQQELNQLNDLPIVENAPELSSSIANHIQIIEENLKLKSLNQADFGQNSNNEIAEIATQSEPYTQFDQEQLNNELRKIDEKLFNQLCEQENNKKMIKLQVLLDSLKDKIDNDCEMFKDIDKKALTSDESEKLLDSDNSDDSELDTDDISVISSIDSMERSSFVSDDEFYAVSGKSTSGSEISTKKKKSYKQKNQIKSNEKMSSSTPLKINEQVTLDCENDTDKMSAESVEIDTQTKSSENLRNIEMSTAAADNANLTDQVSEANKESADNSNNDKNNSNKTDNEKSQTEEDNQKNQQTFGNAQFFDFPFPPNMFPPHIHPSHMNPTHMVPPHMVPPHMHPPPFENVPFVPPMPPKEFIKNNAIPLPYVKARIGVATPTQPFKWVHETNFPSNVSTTHATSSSNTSSESFVNVKKESQQDLNVPTNLDDSKTGEAQQSSTSSVETNNQKNDDSFFDKKTAYSFSYSKERIDKIYPDITSNDFESFKNDEIKTEDKPNKYSCKDEKPIETATATENVTDNTEKNSFQDKLKLLEGGSIIPNVLLSDAIKMVKSLLESVESKEKALVLLDEMSKIHNQRTDATQTETDEKNTTQSSSNSSNEGASNMNIPRAGSSKESATYEFAQSTDVPNQSSASASNSSSGYYANNSIGDNLCILYEMGFKDDDMNEKLLRMYDNNLEKVIHSLI